VTRDIHPHLNTFVEEMLQSGWTVRAGSPGGQDFVRVVEPNVLVNQSSGEDCYLVQLNGEVAYHGELAGAIRTCRRITVNFSRD